MKAPAPLEEIAWSAMPVTPDEMRSLATLLGDAAIVAVGQRKETTCTFALLCEIATHLYRELGYAHPARRGAARTWL